VCQFPSARAQNLNPARSRVPLLQIGRAGTLHDSTPDFRQRSTHSRPERAIPRPPPRGVSATSQVREPLRLADMGRGRHPKAKHRQRSRRSLQVRSSRRNKRARHNWNLVCEYPRCVHTSYPVIFGSCAVPLIAGFPHLTLPSLLVMSQNGRSST
jgi:hypothetical protein